MKLSPRYREALAYAYDAHRDQARKGAGTPYLAHLLAVSSLAMEHGADEDQAIAALLHDAAEDAGAAILADIDGRFGRRVGDIVRACTDSLESPKPPWRERKLKYLAHLAASPAEAQLVAACDKLHNLRCVAADYRLEGEALWSRFNGGRAGVLWYYRELVKAFPAENPVSGALRRSLGELESLLPENRKS